MANIRQKVGLEGIQFYAYHGFYPEEQKVGNNFLVDIETEMLVKENISDDLSSTLNYETLFEIAETHMKVPVKLLETVAHQILKEIVLKLPAVEHVKVSIRKLNLPVKGEVKSSLVELTYTK